MNKKREKVKQPLKSLILDEKSYKLGHKDGYSKGKKETDNSWKEILSKHQTIKHKRDGQILTKRKREQRLNRQRVELLERLKGELSKLIGLINDYD